MGTTFSGVLIKNNIYAIGHIGDSRIYLYSDGKLQQLTKDDSYVQKLIDAGEIDKEQARKHEEKNLITKVLGEEKFDTSYVSGTEKLNGENTCRLPESGYLLLCTDGIWEAYPESTIEEIFSQETKPEIITEKLIQKAIEEDGSDNATLIVVKFKRIPIFRRDLSTSSRQQ